MTKKMTSKMPTEEQIMTYIWDHRTEDWPMDLTLGEFYDRVLKYSEIVGENKQSSTKDSYIK